MIEKNAHVYTYKSERGVDVMTISERIFKILRDRNMSQNAFAKKAGLASSTISDWKNKKTNPSSDKIMDICEAVPTRTVYIKLYSMSKMLMELSIKPYSMTATGKQSRIL